MFKGFFQFLLSHSWLKPCNESYAAVFAGVGSKDDLILANLPAFNVVEDSVCDLSRCVDYGSFTVFYSDFFPEFALLSELLLGNT